MLISFLVPPPHTQRFQIQAGQLLIEDVTWFLPGLADTSYELVMDHKTEAGAKGSMTTPFCVASAVTTFVRSICCLKLHTCKPVLPSHFISHHYGFGAGKSPELRTVTTR